MHIYTEHPYRPEIVEYMNFKCIHQTHQRQTSRELWLPAAALFSRIAVYRVSHILLRLLPLILSVLGRLEVLGRFGCWCIGLKSYSYTLYLFWIERRSVRYSEVSFRV